jgi:hypothetical protein
VEFLTCGDEVSQLLHLSAQQRSFEDFVISCSSEDFHVSGTLILLPTDPSFVGKIAGIFSDAHRTTVA